RKAGGKLNNIRVECKNITRNITLHAKDLDIVESNVAVESLEGIKNLVTTQGFDKEYDYYVLHLAEPLQVGHKYNVSIPFSGNLTEGLAGYYRSSYVDRATNEIRWLAVTQFESMDARRAFPCFDEPEFKAQFRMVLGHHKNFSGVSNMPLNYTEPMEGRVDWVWDHFLLSERMSTYLLAFMVSDLEYRVSPPSGNNVTFRIWARHDALPQTMFAGDIGPKVLRFYEEYFDVPYPLPKQDMAAIPDFSAGAMENWGLVTYRETTLLYDDNVTTESSKKNIAGVIAHELAHQWFGNLVTMKWWSDLWLNEGFATYISTVGVHKLHPEWKVDESDAVNGLLTVFSFDALTSSHPVFVTIDHPSKIGQIFDTISYKKGPFRVNYDDRNWELISRTLNSDRFTSIGLLNRVQLLVDSMDLAWTGALDYSKALRLVDYLQHETEYLPWHTGFSSFRVLSRLLRRTQAYGHYRNYVRHLLTPIYNKIGNISHVEGKEDLQQAKLRNLVYGGEKEWNFIWERYLASNVGTEKNALLDTLSCTRERWLLSRFLHWSLNETGGIRKQDSGFVFSGVARNDVGYDVAKEFFFDELEHIYNYIISLNQLAQLTKDNEKYFKQSSLSVKQALEKARSNIQWHKNHYQPLLKWYAITQFEAAHARKAFPCFDEPTFKARFKITLGHVKNYSSVSNMPLEKIECLKDLQWDYYKVTPILPTYTIAFMVSDFEYRTYKKNNLTFRIWIRPSKINKTEFADYFEKYFDTKLLLPKMDFVAVPYFHRHAMENWGLGTACHRVYNVQCPCYRSRNCPSVVREPCYHQMVGRHVAQGKPCHDLPRLMILRMVHLLLGEENFQKSMVHYLHTFQYGNADQNDFWSSLSLYMNNSSHLKEIMNTWILQPGFPVVTVTRDYENNSVLVTQERYLINKGMNTDDSCWILPLTYTTQEEANFKNTDPKMWLNCSVKETTYTMLPGKYSWIIFNIKFTDLEILETAVEVRSAIDKKNLVISHSYVLENDYYVLHLSESLEKGHEYFLRIPYKGNLTEGLTGFYRSSYMDLTTKKTRWLAVTQFESIAARKAFPCFDEPEFKARFKVSLGHAENYQSVSNMPVRCTEAMRERPGWIWTHFLESVCMSTYLVAFLVSDFDFRVFPRIPAANFVNFRVWARHDALQQTEFAGAVGPQILNFYEKFFGINFPLPKQDLVAIPDFSAGAMENWGLITFRESTLLAGKEASSDVRENIAGVIAHELAHQWFGNLVTMKWWNDLWLNEGFATYISHIGVHAIRPEWNTLDLNVVQLLEIVLFHDSFQSSHPISHKVETFTAVNEVFDAISYQKGAFMLRMMNLFLGEEVFRQGLNIYLSIFKYRNAEQDDLWNSLTMVAHQQDVLPHNMTIKMIMDTWTLQIGYPVITITRDYPKGTAKITQKRFRRYKDEENDAESCWILPITYTSQVKHEFQSTIPNAWTLCAENSGQVHGLPSQNEWILFNIQAASLCRVNYDKYNWHLLINALHSKQYNEIGLLNRVQLVEDAFGLAWTGDLPYCIAMKLASYLVQEIEYVPWKMASNHLEWFKNFLIRTSAFNIFKASKQLYSLLSIFSSHTFRASLQISQISS
ncbi:hypothetical protein C0J52_04710, partial [Blattella germanica]